MRTACALRGGVRRSISATARNLGSAPDMDDLHDVNMLGGRSSTRGLERNGMAREDAKMSQRMCVTCAANFEATDSLSDGTCCRSFRHPSPWNTSKTSDHSRRMPSGEHKPDFPILPIHVQHFSCTHTSKNTAIRLIKACIPRQHKASSHFCKNVQL